MVVLGDGTLIMSSKFNIIPNWLQYVSYVMLHFGDTGSVCNFPNSSNTPNCLVLGSSKSMMNSCTNVQVFIKGLVRVSNYQTKMVSGPYSKDLLPLVDDSGITNTLLDLHLFKSLSCKLDTILTVPVIDEMLVDAPYSCRKFSWQLQQSKFTSEGMDGVVLQV
jgi:hypothetical protein